jgi:hypothetical protein
MLISGCSSIEGVKRTNQAVSSDGKIWSDNFFSDTAKTTFRIDVNIKSKDISGICVIKKFDGELKGSVINEFGAKVFDFAVNETGCKLHEVNPSLDKDYIRKTIENDLYFLLEADNSKAPFYNEEERFEQDNKLIINYKKKQMLKDPNGSVTLLNLKYGIKYKLRKLIDIDRNKLIL